MSEAKRTPVLSVGPFLFTRFTKPDGGSIATPFEVAEHMADTALKAGGPTLWGVTIGGDSESALVICYTANGPNSETYAEFIARACNSHDDLLAALKHLTAAAECWCLHLGPDGECYRCQSIKAIAKAEGRAK